MTLILEKNAKGLVRRQARNLKSMYNSFIPDSPSFKSTLFAFLLRILFWLVRPVG